MHVAHSEAHRLARVEDLLSVLGLESCGDVRVGNPLERGISGGEARRLSVGVGVADLESVRLLLLDEPTTGLDSSSAAEVMLLARRLAATADRRAVVASVHQPSAEMFSLFDKVLVLVDGRQAFFGSASEASAVLSRPEMGVTLSPGQNPAEFILIAAKAAAAAAVAAATAGSAASGPGEFSAEYSARKAIFDSRADSAAAAAAAVEYLYEEAERGEGDGGGREGWGGTLEHAVEEEEGGVGAEHGLLLLRGGRTRDLLRGSRGRGAYAVGFWAQVSAVWGRSWTVQARRTDSLWALIVKNTFVGALTASVFWQEGSVRPDEALVDPLMNDVTPKASNVMGILYFGMLYGLTGHLQAIPDIFEWKRHSERERAAGMYSTTVYWLVSSTVHLPVLLAGFVVYINVCYWPLGLPVELLKFCVFAGASLMSTLLGYSLAQTLSAALATPQSAFATWPLLLVTAANFAGFTVRLPAVHVWFRWLCDVSFCRWVFQLVVVNEFHDFDEGPQLLDLYFGDDRPSLLVNALIVGLFYAGSLLLALAFLQPRRSRLRVLERPPPASSSLSAMAAATPGGGGGERGDGMVSTGGGGWHEEEGGGGGEEAKEGGGGGYKGVALKKVPGDPGLLQASNGNGPLYFLEEAGRETPPMSTMVSSPMLNDDASILRAPLMGGTPGETSGGVHGAGAREGSTVAFLDLHYYIYLRGGGDPGGDKTWNSTGGRPGASGSKPEAHVLKGVTGVLHPSEMAAILGPSGSGKTTLLDLLGGRKTLSAGRQEGHIIVDGVSESGGRGGSKGPMGSAYVMQDNVHHSALTVRQTLTFAARLRMPSSATAGDRDGRIASMVAMLGLDGVLDTVVGDESKRGISGGEAKRLSIAVESMNLPGLLLLDEPTSGLDATTALEVLTGVRGLANSGRTVVVSLHQPSLEMFDLFDTCLLLTREGYPAYFGKADRAMSYFASIGLTPPPSLDMNPADFMLSLASTGTVPASNEPSQFGVGITVSAAGVGGGGIGGNGGGGGGGGDGGGDGGHGTADGGVMVTGVVSSGSGESDSGGISFDFGVGHVGKDLGAGAPSGYGLLGYDPAGTKRASSSTVGAAGVGDSSGSSTGGDGPPVTVAELGRAFSRSPAAAEARAGAEREVEAGRGEARGRGRRQGDGVCRRRSTLWLSMVLTHRELTTTWQDRSRILLALARHAFVGTFYGTLWWRLGIGRVYERVGVMFFSLVFVMLGNQQNIPRIFQDRLLFYREKGAGVYGPVEYWWSIVIAQVPLAIITTSTYSFLVYFMSGLNENGWEPFGYFLLVMVLSNLVALSFCQMLAAATRLQDTAVALFPVFLFFFIAFGGFIVRLPTLPGYLRAWAPTISFVRWAMEGLVINEFDGNEKAIFPVPEGIPVTPEQIYEAFLEAYGFGEGERRGDVLGDVLWILLGSLVLFRLLSLVFLKYVTFERR